VDAVLSDPTNKKKILVFERYSFSGTVGSMKSLLRFHSLVSLVVLQSFNLLKASYYSRVVASLR
jgi:hypothetical protein